jgi:hypothetical protein
MRMFAFQVGNKMHSVSTWHWIFEPSIRQIDKKELYALFIATDMVQT